MQQGATLPAFVFSFLDDNGAAVPITGATLVLYFYDPTTNQQTQGAGSFAVTNGAGGLALYTWNAQDTAAPFNGYLVVHINAQSGGTYVPDPAPFEIKPLFFLGGNTVSFV